MLSQTRDHLETTLADYRSLTGRITRMRDELASLTVTRHSTDGCAAATVNAWGEIVALTFEPTLAGRLDPPALADRVVAAAQAAAAEARDRKQALLADLVPPGLRHLVDEEGAAGLRLLAGDGPAR